MRPKREHYQLWGVAASIGSFIAGSVIGGLLIGVWVDNRWGTDPIGKALGVLFGGIAGLVEAARTVLKMIKRQ